MFGVILAVRKSTNAFSLNCPAILKQKNYPKFLKKKIYDLSQYVT